MPKKKKYSLKELLGKIDIRRRRVCEGIRADFSPAFDIIPGSSYNHQTWSGGYRDHVEEIMNIACVLYDALDEKRLLEFSLGDALFTLFLHDMDKLYRYAVLADGSVVRRGLYNKDFLKKTKSLLKRDYGYMLSKQELNALAYVHGEGEDYSSKYRVAGPLATFIHCCDVVSARIWFDEGRDERYW